MNATGALIGVALAAGIMAVVGARSLRRPVELAEALASIEQPPGERLTYDKLIERLSATKFEMFREQDLAIVGKSRIDMVSSTVAVGGVAVAVVVLLGAALGTGVLPLGTLTFLAGSGLAVGAVVVKVVQVRADAAKRRKEARAALTVWLNFIALATAFHPVEGSIQVACNAGNSWIFEAMKVALEEARIRKMRIWDALSALGRDWGMREMVDIGVALGHASLQGAKVRDALIAKSETLTAVASAAELADANKGTAKLQGPISVVTIALFGLMLYPALAEFQNLL